MINRENYEAWFVDFLDGKLTEEQRVHLHAFLTLHPDLAAELEEMGADLPVVASEPVKAPVARKEIVAVGALNEASYENAFIAYHENDLTAAEARELELFLDKNPFLRRELAWFGQLAVTHAGETYPHKRALKHSVPLVPVYRYAAAASVLLLLGVGAVWYNRIETREGSGLAYRRVSVPVPKPSVNRAEAPQTYADISPDQAAPKNHTAHPNTVEPDRETVPGRLRMEGTVMHPTESFAALHSTVQEPVLAQTADLYVPQPLRTNGDEMTLVQALGKAIENGVGENSVSEGLKDDRRLTAGDMADLASVAFKKSRTPLLATEKTPAGKRRIKLRLGIFEADFALK